MLTALLVIVACMRGELGQADGTARFSQMFSNSRAVNLLSAARLFLFASRDVWFVVGLPVYLETRLGWSFWQAGAFLAIWVIGYGAVQAVGAEARWGKLAAGRSPSDLARRRSGARRRRRSQSHSRRASIRPSS